MMGKSLRLRLAVAVAVSVAAAMLLAGWSIVAIFERHIVRRIEAELDTYVRQLADDLTLGSGPPQLSREPTHPRFEEPLGGLYWQVEDDATGTTLRSRSLWDFIIHLPRDSSNPGSQHRYDLPGPGGSQLIVSERRISYTEGDHVNALRIAAALDRDDVRKARQEVTGDIARALAALGFILMLASLAWIAFGLRPFDRIRLNVRDVRSGARRRLDLDAPSEVMPLISEFNSLLDSQSRVIDDALARAADLAHGLKTPLTILGSDAERLRQKGEAEIAGEIEDLVATMHHHVGRELARARRQKGARRHAASAEVHTAVSAIVRTLSRSPAGAKLAWHIDIPEVLTVGMQVEDLMELLGVLAENASKWATTEVRIKCAADECVEIIIEDDGPGATETELQHLGRRGVRLDQSVEGHGLGLAIASDITRDYGGTMELGRITPHGFRVTLELPKTA